MAAKKEQGYDIFADDRQRAFAMQENLRIKLLPHQVLTISLITPAIRLYHEYVLLHHLAQLYQKVQYL